MTKPPLTIAVIGAGRAGRAFSASCAVAGFRVVLEDVMPAKLRHAEEEFASLGRAVTLVSTVEDAVRDADLVVDFVPDELESKLEIWSLIDRMAPPEDSDVHAERGAERDGSGQLYLSGRPLRDGARADLRGCRAGTAGADGAGDLGGDSFAGGAGV